MKVRVDQERWRDNETRRKTNSCKELGDVMGGYYRTQLSGLSGEVDDGGEICEALLGKRRNNGERQVTIRVEVERQMMED